MKHSPDLAVGTAFCSIKLLAERVPYIIFINPILPPHKSLNNI